MPSDAPSNDLPTGEFAAQALLRRALERHRLGDLDSAITHYRRALESGALTNDAVAAEAQRLLGVALRIAGDPASALSALDHALRLSPDPDPAILDPIKIERSAALQDLGRSQDAVAALNAMPTDALETTLAQAVLADAYRALGLPKQAAPHYQRLVDRAPSAENFVNLGACLQETGDLSGAVARYKDAVALDDAFGPAFTNLGLALMETDALPDAVAPLKRGVALDPQDALALNALGAVYLRLGRDTEAEQFITQATQKAPNYAPAWSNLGNVYQDQRRMNEALAAHDKAVALDSENADLHWNRAMSLLLSGDLSRGFAEYEWRKGTRTHAPSPHDSRLWDGGDLTGKNILLIAEQGFGDMIQFARYAPLLVARGAHVTLTCPPKLADLFQTLGDSIKIVTKISGAKNIDCHAPLMSLPFLCGTDLDSVPAADSYLTPPPGAKQPPAADERKRIGLCWTGNPDHPDNPHRSCSLDELAPLFKIDGVEWINLQFDAGSMTNDDARHLTDWRSYLNGFADTAAAICALDLVITIDTSTAHLTGALGRPGWVLLKYAPDWRWMLDRDDSPWYPSLRLFRQSRAGVWGDVIDRLTQRLKDWMTAT